MLSGAQKKFLRKRQKNMKLIFTFISVKWACKQNSLLQFITQQTEHTLNDSTDCLLGIISTL